MNATLKKNTNIFILSILVALLLTMTYTYKHDATDNLHILLARFAIYLFLSLIVGILISPDREKIGIFLYRYRWPIGVVLIAIGVLLDINGSSLAIWGGYYGYSETDIVFGTAHAIRSDEWATFTPFALSQEYTNYAWYSDIIRGTTTDVSVVYGQPILHVISMIFRPFLDGFVLFGSSRGLAFFWCARFVVLWLVTFDLALLLTNARKLMSLLMAMLLSLSPLIQWWFAINGLVEMLIFGSVAVLALNRYMRERDLRKRAGNLLLMVWAAGGYVLTFYPALMVSLGYFFVLLALWVLIKNWKIAKFSYKDIIEIVLALLLFAACMGYFFYKTWDVVTVVMNTAYPGHRISTGGGWRNHLLMSWGNLFFPLKEAGLPDNACECAAIFDLFPLGILLSIYGMVKNKKADGLSVLMILGTVFFGIYCAIGFPTVLAKVTFMSYSIPKRAITAFGLCNLVLLVRSVSIYTFEGKRMIKILVSACYALFVGYTSYRIYGGYITRYDAIVLLVLSFLALYLLLNCSKTELLPVVILSLVIVFAGGMVNPVQYSLANVQENPVADAVQEIVANDPDAIWTTESLAYPMGNNLMMQGASCVTSTHVYPDLELWRELDPSGQYEWIYNRYEHINLNLIGDEEECATFESVNDFDYITINVAIDELSEILHVQYIFTGRDLSGYKSDAHALKLVSTAGNYLIYEIVEIE